MGRWTAKICLHCQRKVNKRRQKSCPKCGGKIVSLTAELIEKLCLSVEKKKERKEKKTKRFQFSKKKKKQKLMEGEIW